MQYHLKNNGMSCRRFQSWTTLAWLLRRCVSGRCVSFLSLMALVSISVAAYTLSGVVTDAETGVPVEAASVSFKVKGKVHTAMTDSLGLYSFSLEDDSRFVAKVSHNGYHAQTRLIIIGKSGKEKADFSLKAKDNTLNEVVVNADAARVAQRNDTTVYFANAYKVNSDATAYDLISQKLPGIGIRDGKLEAHGETVKEILIDGKEYFKSDITMSLKNLPADIINEIQLFDKVSDYSRLTGFDDGSRRKTINLVTKKGMDTSLFGKAYAGYGLDNYYKAYGMLNWFDGDRQLSVFAQANNTSEQNFSMIDLLSTTGSSMNTAPQQSPYSKGSSDTSFHPATSNDISDMMVGGYSAGETTTKAAGANFSDVWDARTTWLFQDITCSTTPLTRPIMTSATIIITRALTRICRLSMSTPTTPTTGSTPR